MIYHLIFIFYIFKGVNSWNFEFEAPDIYLQTNKKFFLNWYVDNRTCSIQDKRLQKTKITCIPSVDYIPITAIYKNENKTRFLTLTMSKIQYHWDIFLDSDSTTNHSVFQFSIYQAYPHQKYELMNAFSDITRKKKNTNRQYHLLGGNPVVVVADSCKDVHISPPTYIDTYWKWTHSSKCLHYIVMGNGVDIFNDQLKEKEFTIPMAEKYHISKTVNQKDNDYKSIVLRSEKMQLLKDPCSSSIEITLAGNSTLISYDEYTPATTILCLGCYEDLIIDVTFGDTFVFFMFKNSVFTLHKFERTWKQIRFSRHIGDFQGIICNSECQPDFTERYCVVWTQSHVYRFRIIFEVLRRIFLDDVCSLKDNTEEIIRIGILYDQMYLLACGSNRTSCYVTVYGVLRAIGTETSTRVDTHIGNDFQVSPIRCFQHCYLLWNEEQVYSYYGQSLHNHTEEFNNLVNNSKIMQVVKNIMDEHFLYTSNRNIIKFVLRDILRKLNVKLQHSQNALLSLRNDGDVTVKYVQDDTIVHIELLYSDADIPSHGKLIDKCPVYKSKRFDNSFYEIDQNDIIHIHAKFVEYNHMRTMPKFSIEYDTERVIIDEKIITQLNMHRRESQIDFKIRRNKTFQQNLNPMQRIDRYDYAGIEIIFSNDEDTRCPIKTRNSMVKIGCPKHRHIRVKRPTKGCDKYKSYNIQSKVRINNWISEEITYTKYDYEKYGCPINEPTSGGMKPEIMLYDGDTFIQILNSNFVVWLEKSKARNFMYTKTERDANCKRSRPRESRGTWSLQDWHECFDKGGISDSRKPFEILNRSFGNSIAFKRLDGQLQDIWIFGIRIIDPDLSYCELNSTFAVMQFGSARVDISHSLFLSEIIAAFVLGIIGLFSYIYFTAFVYESYASK